MRGNERIEKFCIFRGLISMKKITLLLAIGLGGSMAVKSQTQAEVKTQIDAASAALAKKDFRNVDKSLNQALVALAKLSGKELSKMLPLELAGLKSLPEKDLIQVGSAIMAPGNVIQRSYGAADGSKIVDMKVRPLSPELSQVNMYISNPVYLKSTEKQIEKIVTVNGRKALLKINNELKQAELHIISGNTLYSIEGNGAEFSEAEMIAMAAKIEIGKMETILK